MKKFYLSEAPTDKLRREFRDHIEAAYTDTECSILALSMLGKDIDLYRIGKGKRNILFVGAHHAMEYISTSALFFVIEKMSDFNKCGKKICGIDLNFILKKFSLWFVPCLNPDGVDMHLSGTQDSPLRERQIKMNGGNDFSEWQANARGVDLNHNYDFCFYEYKKLESEEGIVAGKTRYSGEYPESEPETSAICGLVRFLKPEVVLSFHTQGEVIYPHPIKNLDKLHLASSIARILSYEISAPDGLAAYGGFCDYTGEVLNIPSFTVELGKGKNPLNYASLPSISEKLARLCALLPTLL